MSLLSVALVPTGTVPEDVGGDFPGAGQWVVWEDRELLSSPYTLRPCLQPGDKVPVDHWGGILRHRQFCPMSLESLAFPWSSCARWFLPVFQTAVLSVDFDFVCKKDPSAAGKAFCELRNSALCLNKLKIAVAKNTSIFNF